MVSLTSKTRLRLEIGWCGLNPHRERDLSLPPIMGIEFYKPEIHEKAWGRELWIRNGTLYCGKILQFNQHAKFSFHFHVKKEETWFVSKGLFYLDYFDTTNAEKQGRKLQSGDVIHIPQGQPHQLTCLIEGEIFEVSTQHFEDDSFRIGKGDSQSPSSLVTNVISDGKGVIPWPKTISLV